jgi:undecaprenyl-diphosphatase
LSAFDSSCGPAQFVRCRRERDVQSLNLLLGRRWCGDRVLGHLSACEARHDDDPGVRRGPDGHADRMATPPGTEPARSTPARRRIVAVTAVGAVAALLFVALALFVRTDHGRAPALDQRMADRLHRLALAHPDLVTVEKLISTVFAPDVFRAAAVIAGVVLWRARRRRLAATVVIAVLGTGLWSSLGKLVVDRHRPSFAHPVASAGGLSYPSGHALTSFVACGVAVVLCFGAARRWPLAPALLVVAAVGTSRLLLGVHYLTDVIGGWLLGTAWLCAAFLLTGASGPALPRRRPGRPVARGDDDQAS